MRNSIKRTMVAIAAGIVASTLLASPALAATFSFSSANLLITIKDGGVTRGTVVVGVTDGFQPYITVCDRSSDGWIVTGRVDPGNGNVVAVSTNGVGLENCETRFFSSMRKWRAAYAGQASDWHPGP